MKSVNKTVLIFSKIFEFSVIIAFEYFFGTPSVIEDAATVALSSATGNPEYCDSLTSPAMLVRKSCDAADLAACRDLVECLISKEVKVVCHS